MNFFWFKFFLIFITAYTCASANIQLIKKQNSDSNTTLLVIAGIHGDEPGGYFAASILATHYKINSKNLWIVPNLNQESIQENNRGINGDMNRKFSTLKENDKDEKIIKEIKEIILEKNVSLVLNLHDGHGFYRKENHGKIFNPNAWGQTCVIDQCALNENQEFGNLNTIALDVKERINKKLLKEHHSFDIKNTNTKFDDEAMQLSLTYFAVTNNKPAFAIESSKDLSSLAQKIFYQLLAIEEFMSIMGISYIREFELNENSIDEIIQNYGILNINNNISLNLTNIKKSLSFIPIELTGNVFEFSNPLGSIAKNGNEFVVYRGNEKVTKLRPQYFKMAESCTRKFDVLVDGVTTSLQSGSDIFVSDSFNILNGTDCRVNIIGYKSRGNIDESGITVKLKDLDESYSLDNSNKVYRVEFYKNDEFCFMSKVHFQ